MPGRRAATSLRALGLRHELRAREVFGRESVLNAAEVLVAGVSTND